MISSPTAISIMMGVLHFMAISTGPVLNYRTLGPRLGAVNFAARHRALPKVRHRDRRAPSGSRCGSGRGARDLSTICVTIASRLVIVRRRPSIVTTTVSFSASASNAGRLLALRRRQRLTFEASQRPFYIGMRGYSPNAGRYRFAGVNGRERPWPF